MLQELGYVFEILAALATFSMSYFVLRNNRKYIGNQLMALSTFGVGLYALCIFLYDVIGTELAVLVLYRVALISLIFGTMLMYITMQIMVHSSAWLKAKWKWGLLTLAALALSIYIIVDDFITIISLDPMNTQIEFVVLMAVSLWVIVILITSIFDLYFHGIKKMENSPSRRRMIIFETGLGINIIAVVLTAISNLTSNVVLGKVMDILFFAVLALGTSIMAIGFIKKKEERL